VRSLRATALRRTRKARSNYYAFLSYSHKDEELADWLHEELEAFHVPTGLAGKVTANGVVPKRLTPIFRDEHELAAADDLGEEIRSALAASQYLIVLCSPNAATSHWTNAEIECFKRVRPDGCVLAAIGSGEPFASENPGHEDDECFPPALREKYDRRGRPTGRKAEPLAADLRGGPDERRMGFLKLVAGMLGVGMDDLVQREATRRQRRLAWLTAASISGMAITSLLAVTAIQGREEAREQRREAEGLVAFMLGDLKDKLEPIGKLDALDGVGAKVLAYYRKQDTSELSDAGLLQRSKALSLSAQVAYSRGQLDTAEKLYGEALNGTAEAIRRDPKDSERLFDHAQNVFYTGAIAADRGELAKAEKMFREYQQLARQMTSIQPDNLRYRMEVQYAATNLGALLVKQRRFDEAASQFNVALRTMEAIAAVDPANEMYRKSFNESLAWLADVQFARGDLQSAAATRTRQVQLLRSWMSGKSDVAYEQRLIPAERSLGNFYWIRGDSTKASEHYRSAIAVADSLMAVEPDNTQWREYSFQTRLDFAQRLFLAGRIDEAKSLAEAGCISVQQLLAKNNEVPNWRAGLRDCRQLRMEFALSGGKTSDAIGEAQAAIAAAKTVRSNDRLGDIIALARTYRLLGDAQRAAGDTDSARRSWEQALAVIPSGVAERPFEQKEHLVILERLGRSQEARPIAARLNAIGYRSAS